MHEFDVSEIIKEAERVLQAAKKGLAIPESSEVDAQSDKKLNPYELYDWVTELLPLSEKVIKNRPEYIASSLDASLRGNILIFFNLENSFYRIKDDWSLNSVNIARFSVDETGKPLELVEQATISAGIEGTEDPGVPAQAIQYYSPKLYEIDPNYPDLKFPRRDTQRTAEAIKEFLNRIDRTSLLG